MIKTQIFIRLDKWKNPKDRWHYCCEKIFKDKKEQERMILKWLGKNILLAEVGKVYHPEGYHKKLSQEE